MRSRHSVRKPKRFSPRKVMCSQWSVLWLCVVTSTVSSTTWWNFSRSVVNPQTPTIFSWETMLTEATIQLRLLPYLSHSRLDSRKELPYSEVIMSPDRLRKSMASMMSVSESTEMLMSGNTTLIFLTFCHLQLSLRTKFSASMEVFPLILIRWIKSDRLTDKSRCLTRDLCVIFSGRTQTTDMDGVFPHVELDSLSVQTYLRISTTLITWN